MTAGTRIAASNGVDFFDIMSQSAYIFIFILGLILLIGNVIITQYWMMMIERTGNEAAVKSAVRIVNWADVFFTTPGIFLAVIAGHILTDSFGGYETGWVLWATITFPIVGVLWLAGLVPMQNKLARLAETSKKLDDGFYSLLHKWYVIGALTTLLSIAVAALAIVQPTL